MAKKKSAKSGGAAPAVLKKALEKKTAKAASRPVESDEESEESGNFVTFDKKRKGDSDDEDEDREIFDLALDRDEDDEVRFLTWKLAAACHLEGMITTWIMNYLMIYYNHQFSLYRPSLLMCAVVSVLLYVQFTDHRLHLHGRTTRRVLRAAAPMRTVATMVVMATVTAKRTATMRARRTTRSVI